LVSTRFGIDDLLMGTSVWNCLGKWARPRRRQSLPRKKKKGPPGEVNNAESSEIVGFQWIGQLRLVDGDLGSELFGEVGTAKTAPESPEKNQEGPAWRSQ